MSVSDDTTTTKTVWTEHVLETLYTAMRQGADDASVREVLKDLKGKGMTVRYLVGKVRKKVGETEAQRLQAIVTGKSRRKAAKDKAGSGGLVGSIKKLFGG